MNPITSHRISIDTPRWAYNLFHKKTAPDGKPVRNRVAYGGRSGWKTWSFARRALVLGTTQPLRFLCVREVQNTIRDSVHKVLRDQIHQNELGQFFDDGEHYLKSYAGAEFLYKGIRHNSKEIKSTEGVDILWVEEAQNVSDESWEILIPTIRKPGSEIWVSFNPDNEKDPTYDRFITNTPPGTVIQKVNFYDNPKQSEAVLAEMRWLRETDYEAYLHVWEGQPRTDTEAQILKGKYRSEPFEPDPANGWHGPYYGADWGFNDPTVLVQLWIHDGFLFVRREAYAVNCDIDDTPKLFNRIEGADKHVIYADCARPETINYMKRHGFPKMQPVKKWTGSVEDGIAHIRSYKGIIIHPSCKNTLSEAHLYSYKLDRLTGDPLDEIIDKNNHCIDAIRYGVSKLIVPKTAKQGFVAGMY